MMMRRARAGLAVATMRGAKFPCLASIDGDQPRLRPVSPVRTDGFTVYVANLRPYHKTQEIAAIGAFGSSCKAQQELRPEVCD